MWEVEGDKEGGRGNGRFKRREGWGGWINGKHRVENYGTGEGKGNSGRERSLREEDQFNNLWRFICGVSHSEMFPCKQS